MSRGSRRGWPQALHLHGAKSILRGHAGHCLLHPHVGRGDVGEQGHAAAAEVLIVIQVVELFARPPTSPMRRLLHAQARPRPLQERACRGEEDDQGVLQQMLL